MEDTYIFVFCCIRAVGSFLEFTHDETEVVSYNFLCTISFLQIILLINNACLLQKFYVEILV